MSPQTTIVISQDASTHSGRQALEEELVRGAVEAGCETLVISHLPDLQPDGPSLQAVREIDGPLIVLAWLYPRATYWTLDRHGIRGRRGRTEQAGAPAEALPVASADPGRTAPQRPLPNREIHCLDLRQHEHAAPYLDEIRRLVQSGGGPFPANVPDARRFLETGPRRWYPVIDFCRCTNCMECIDFCLFGVYGLDAADTLLVEQPDNCRKGCPACSRVCPEHAIIFPQHKSPAIAGGPAEAGTLKLDLSQLFGGAPPPSDTVATAARERDEHLLAAGRPAVGQAPADPAKDSAPAGRDDLDRLIDRLDEVHL